jgi:hypothetical protein
MTLGVADNQGDSLDDVARCCDEVLPEYRSTVSCAENAIAYFPTRSSPISLSKVDDARFLLRSRR